jgi:hypothetical protein
MELFDNELAAEIANDPSVPPEHIRGVRCDAVNCAYHDGERFCTARAITVGSQSARGKGDTFCRTFERRASAAT